MQFSSVPALILGLLLTMAAATAPAAEWPQYRGPDQTGVSSEKVSVAWSAGGPKVLWKIPTPNGFSSFAVSGGMAYTEVNRHMNDDAREVCLALDAATGREKWAADVGSGSYRKGGDAGAKGNDGGDGPRSTPTVNDGRVYVYNQDLVLHCLDAATGKSLWTHDVIRDNKGRNIGWNSAASPVIDGERVFIGGGGSGQSLLALNKKTGDVLWKSLDEKITHSTPLATTIGGQRQVIFFLQSGLTAVSPEDGKELWHFPFKYKVSSAISPVVGGDLAYCSAGYGVGGGACKVVQAHGGLKAEALWKIEGDKLVANHWSTPVLKDGHLYGMFSFKKFGSGPLKCVELATGKVKWEQPGFGAGNVILAGDTLLALSDDGQVVAVKATPTAYHELARAKVLKGKCWSTPALSDGRLYVRSTKEGACLDLSGT